MKITVLSLRFILLLGAILLGIVLYLLYIFSYEEVLLYIVTKTDKPYLLSLLRERFFTQQKFEFSRFVVTIFLVFYAGFVLIVWHKIQYIVSFFKYNIFQFLFYANIILRHYCSIPIYLKIIMGLLGGLLFLKATYYLLYPIQYDEAWTYNYFIDNNLLISLAAYNNHPLFTLVAHLFKILPFDMTINLRLPVFLTGFGCIFFIFPMLRHWFGTMAAFIGTVFFAFSCPITFYMLYARGYIFTVFFTQVLLILHFIPSPKPQEAKGLQNWVYYLPHSSIVALGLYSMPTFVYVLFPLASYHLYCIVKNFLQKDNTATQMHSALLLSIILGFAASSLLYLPMILGTGIDLGIGVASNAKLSLYDIMVQKLDRYMYLIWYFFTGTIIKYCYIVVLFLIVFLTVIKQANKLQRHLVLLSAFYLLMPIVALLGQGVAVPERVWTFLVVYLAILMAAFSRVLLRFFSSNIQFCIVLAMSIILVIGQSWAIFRHDFINWSYSRDIDCKEIAQAMLQYNVKNYYTDFDYYKPAIEYFYRLKNQPIHAYSADSNSASYAIWQSDIAKYDCVISNKFAKNILTGLPSENYICIRENEEAVLYLATRLTMEKNK